MNDEHIKSMPEKYQALRKKCEEAGFNMASDLLIGPLLRALASSKPGGRFLELGTGAGLSLVWMADGLIGDAHLITIDNDPQLTEMVKQQLDTEDRIEFICEDGAAWLKAYQGSAFDIIFADAWPGKYQALHRTLELLKVGGLYVIDDLKKQANWPEGHEQKVAGLISYLDNREDFHLAKMTWSTGVIVATKKS